MQSLSHQQIFPHVFALHEIFVERAHSQTTNLKNRRPMISYRDLKDWSLVHRWGSLLVLF